MKLCIHESGFLMVSTATYDWYQYIKSIFSTLHLYLFFNFQVLQQQLIKAERDRILQQIQSGALPAETAKQLAEELEELDEDGALSRKMKSVPKPSVTPVPSTKPAKSGGGRRWLLLLLFLYESNYASNLRIFFREKLTSVTLSSTEHNCNLFLFPTLLNAWKDILFYFRFNSWNIKSSRSTNTFIERHFFFNKRNCGGITSWNSS